MSQLKKKKDFKASTLNQTLKSQKEPFLKKENKNKNMYVMSCAPCPVKLPTLHSIPAGEIKMFEAYVWTFVLIFPGYTRIL